MAVDNLVNVFDVVGGGMREDVWNPSIIVPVFVLLQITHINNSIRPFILSTILCHLAWGLFFLHQRFFIFVRAPAAFILIDLNIILSILEHNILPIFNIEIRVALTI